MSKSHAFRLSNNPDSSDEVQESLRLLALQPWLVSGRDDESIAKVRRNVETLRSVFLRLGWALVVERDLVRLKKMPPAGGRIADWAMKAPSPLACSWTFLLAAAAEGLPHQATLGQLVEAAKATAAEAGTPVTNTRGERRAIAQAISQLVHRGVIDETDGAVNDYIENEDAAVLLTIFHTRLLHLIAHFDPEVDPVTKPDLWLERVTRQPDPARRMRHRLVDDTCLHTVDLDDTEIDWLSRRLREEGNPLADAFGLTVERRSEGAALVVPEESFRWPRELGDTPFPGPGVISHAALLLSEHVGVEGEVGAEFPGPGWRGMARSGVFAKLIELADSQTVGRGGWPAEAVQNPVGLMGDVEGLLVGAGLLRIIDSHWWLSPVTGRWGEPEPPKATKKTIDSTDQLEMF